MLPEKMQLVVIKQTAKQFHAVSHLMHRQDVTELIIATDAGREGELVARWIMQKAGWKGKTKRLWVSSQTDKAIREGFAHLRPAAEYDSLYRAAQGRAEADWLVGLNVTRALTCKHNAQLSAGRVQTPTLALIVQREEEIRAFRPKEYFSVQAQFDGFRALYRDERGQSRFFDRARAERIVSSCAGQAAVVARLHKELKKLPPPAAYDLTELQRDANKKYAYSAKQTLSIMQRLYETHKLLTIRARIPAIFPTTSCLPPGAAAWDHDRPLCGLCPCHPARKADPHEGDRQQSKGDRPPCYHPHRGAGRSLCPLSGGTQRL